MSFAPILPHTDEFCWVIPGSGRSGISKCSAVEGPGHQPPAMTAAHRWPGPWTFDRRAATGNRKCLEGCSLCCHWLISISHWDGCWCPFFARRRVGWCPFRGHDHSVFGVGSLGPSVIFMEWRSNLSWKEWLWIGWSKTVYRSTFYTWHYRKRWRQFCIHFLVKGSEGSDHSSFGWVRRFWRDLYISILWIRAVKWPFPRQAFTDLKMSLP